MPVTFFLERKVLLIGFSHSGFTRLGVIHIMRFKIFFLHRDYYFEDFKKARRSAFVYLARRLPAAVAARFLRLPAAFSAADNIFLAAFGRYRSPVSEDFLPELVPQSCRVHFFNLFLEDFFPRYPPPLFLYILVASCIARAECFPPIFLLASAFACAQSFGLVLVAVPGDFLPITKSFCKPFPCGEKYFVNAANDGLFFIRITISETGDT